MSGFDSSDDHRPVTWLRGQPIYAAHFIVLVFVGSLLATTLLLFAKAERVLGWLPFTSELVLRGEIWRAATYGFYNEPSLWFVLDMFMIVWFGRELERFFGRRIFLSFYLSLYFLTPLLFTAIGTWFPLSLAGQSGALGLFIAFVTLHPDLPMLFGVPARWLAAILVGIYSLMSLASHGWATLISLWATTGFAYAFVLRAQGRFTLPSLNLSPPKSKLRALPDLKSTETSKARSSKETAMAEIDILLDKIAQSGFASLTAKERARLDAARDQLRKK